MPDRKVTKKTGKKRGRKLGVKVGPYVPTLKQMFEELKKLRTSVTKMEKRLG